MKYYVRMTVVARYETEVDAVSLEEAKEMASDNWCGADFGAAVDVEGGDIIYVEDDNGERLYESL